MKPTIYLIIILLFLYTCKNGNNNTSYITNTIKQDSITKKANDELISNLKDLFKELPVYCNEDSIKYFFIPKLDLVDSLRYEIYFVSTLPQNMQPSFREIIIQQIITSKERVIKQFNYSYVNPVFQSSVSVKDTNNNNKLIKILSLPDNSFRFLNTIKGYNFTDTIIGDFNADGKKEFATTNMVCSNDAAEEDIKCNIVFSDKRIPKIPILGLKNVKLINEGDLNSDGSDEIGFLQESNTTFSSRHYFIVALKNNKWKYYIINNSVEMRAAGIKLIEKDKLKKGFVYIRNSKYADCSSPDVIEESVELK
ncbi:MAG: hypothetical protein ACOYMA_14415 [Bacteroidia bacterium]